MNHDPTFDPVRSLASSSALPANSLQNIRDVSLVHRHISQNFKIPMILIQIQLVESRSTFHDLETFQTQETCEMVSEKNSPLARGIWRRDEMQFPVQLTSVAIKFHLKSFKLLHPWLHIFDLFQVPPYLQCREVQRRPRLA